MITSLKAFSAFVLICAFPALIPAESSFLGNRALLKFPSLIRFAKGVILEYRCAAPWLIFP